MKKLERIKNKIKERAPKVIAKVSTVVALSAIAAAVCYREKYLRCNDKYHEVIGDEFLEVHPELLREVREEGAIMKFKMDKHGNKYFTTNDEPFMDFEDLES